ncbi:MAG: DNA replication/repair protein RecF [Chloroflexi bacterium]|nr:DNA replication/repair protein RecF [Chloroflexota bacterium]
MWVRHLSLTNFRNYRRQEMTLGQGPSLLLGDNAQGKSNLVEALFLLATTRSERAQTDGELIHWDALGDPQPVARVTAQVERREGPLQLEVIVAARAQGPDAATARTRGRVLASKRLRVNGVARRQQDMVGQLTAVLFTTRDLELIDGAPSERRRFLDVTLSQLDPAYLQALQRYGKVITQRNALLRRIQDGAASPDELTFWDGELARDGGALLQQRSVAVAALAEHAREAHRRLSGGQEELTVTYQPRLEGWDGSPSGAQPEAALQEALAAGRRRDIAAGVTLTGPHRDDLTFALNGVAAASFASRGQQRTAALALRLAEARFMAERKGDLPVVLLDDVLSELDENRRHAVLASLGEWDQLIITSADADRFGEEIDAAAAFRVSAGTLEAV